MSGDMDLSKFPRFFALCRKLQCMCFYKWMRRSTETYPTSNAETLSKTENPENILFTFKITELTESSGTHNEESEFWLFNNKREYERK